MSNDYYTYSNTLLPGQVARAEDVEAELSAVVAGFGLLPKPRPDGEGFAEPFTVAPAVDDNQAANLGQLKVLETAAGSSATNAASSAQSTEADAIATAADRVQTGQDAQSAEDSATNASDSETLAQKWATESIDVEVVTGQFSARHWASKAAEITSGARAYQGIYDASGGTYPIASPVTEDAGKYWLISEGGTLPAGVVSKGDELAISANQTYQIIRLSAVYAQKTNNLSDLSSAASARTNLGLGTAAVETVGTGANQVPKRDASGKIPGDVLGRALTITNASEAERGSIRLASVAQALAGTDIEKAVTPAGLSASVGKAIPTGVIVMWSGSEASIPAGWALCNGANGTPDLRGKFVIAAGGTYAVGATGGSANAVVVSHNHGASADFNGNHAHSGSTNTAGNHAHTDQLGRNVNELGSYPAPGGGGGGTMTTDAAGNHSHSLSINAAGNHNHGITVNAAGESGTGKNLPPYYALALIMRL
jgi:hypothetical protein